MGKLKECVEQFGQQAILSKKLATIITDVPIAFDEEALAYQAPNEPKLFPILEELEFNTIIPRIFNSGGGVGARPFKESKPSQRSMFGKPSTESAEAPQTLIGDLRIFFEIKRRRSASLFKLVVDLSTTNSSTISRSILAAY
jgi:DNA polymerase-1